MDQSGQDGLRVESYYESHRISSNGSMGGPIIEDGARIPDRKKSYPSRSMKYPPFVYYRSTLEYNAGLRHSSNTGYIEWQEASRESYQQLKKEAELMVAKIKGSTSDIERLMHECAFRIVKINPGEGVKEQPLDHCDALSDVFWKDLMPDVVVDFCRQERQVPFLLEITWAFKSFVIDLTPGQRSFDAIYSTIMNAMVPSWPTDEFLPIRTLDSILNLSTISALVKGDKTLGPDSVLNKKLEMEQKVLDLDSFVRKIDAEGTRLMATCICARVRFECLYAMLESNIKDTDLPFANVEKILDRTKGILKEQCEKYRDILRVEFLKKQALFCVYTFCKDPEDHIRADDRESPQRHVLIPSGIAIPILQKESEYIDSGGYGTVWKVRIHHDYHNFNKDRKAFFAVKKIAAAGAPTDSRQEDERKALEKISVINNPHIVVHYASWLHKSDHHLLLPYAERGNLQQYLDKELAPELNGDNVLWFLGQITGLTDALSVIHRVAKSDMQGIPANTPSEEVPPQQSGFHHDLKPQNILLFGGLNQGQPTMKISDFGLAKLDAIITLRGSYRRQGRIPGDREYCAPDFYQGKGSSRPYDIWSLGCVFLEMLLWFQGGGKTAVAEFRNARKNEVAPGGLSNDGCFWRLVYIPGGTQVEHKQSVLKTINDLRAICHNRGVFNGLIESINKMLEVKPENRLSTADTLQEFKAHLDGAREHLTNDAGFYLRPHDPNIYSTGFAPPSDVGNTHGSYTRRAGPIAQFRSGDRLSVPPDPNRSVTDQLLPTNSPQTLPEFDVMTLNSGIHLEQDQQQQPLESTRRLSINLNDRPIVVANIGFAEDAAGTAVRNEPLLSYRNTPRREDVSRVENNIEKEDDLGEENDTRKEMGTEKEEMDDGKELEESSKEA